MLYIGSLIRSENSQQQPNGQWVPALALRCPCLRCRLRVLRDAWAVIRGRAEAVTWNGKGE